MNPMFIYSDLLDRYGNMQTRLVEHFASMMSSILIRGPTTMNFYQTKRILVNNSFQNFVAWTVWKNIY